MSVREQLQHTLQLLQQERQADLEQYRQKILLLPLHRKTKEGKCWYPVRLRGHHIGTGERLIVELERTRELDQPHIFGSGKLVSIFCNANGTPEKQSAGGVINYVRENLMTVTLHADELPDWIEDGMLGVDLMFDETSYREMEFAMKAILKAEENRSAQLRDILLGEQAPVFESKKIDLSASPLNDSQKAALQRMLAVRDVGIIHGPPGTGKTTTLVQAIVHTVQEEKQALVTAPSNAAVDLLADKLSDQGLRVLRIGHPARVTEQSLSKTLDARIAQHRDYSELRSLRKRIEQLRDMAFKYKRKYGWAEKEQRRMLLEEAKVAKADADVLEFYIVNDLLQNSDVITCTLVGASHPLLKGKRWKTVFIDEAAQALEPACWIAILKAERVIFAGDHQQLPPTIKSAEAARQGLATTLMEKCIAQKPQAAAMLGIQYRMHEAIMDFSSQYFYQGQLRAHESVRGHHLPGQPPVLFVDTAGCGFAEWQDPETLSRNNKEEGRLLLKMIENLIEQVGVDVWLDKCYTLGIITPYSAQVEFLRQEAENSPTLGAIAHLATINTVDAFQGQERDAIAVSFVRSNDTGEVGFLADIRRTNVAMTRARKKLILVGDSATLGAHPFYLELINHMQQQGNYKSAFELP
jgi:ATP-dependent RNA/DNA helicase IGHMBP2